MQRTSISTNFWRSITVLFLIVRLVVTYIAVLWSNAVWSLAVGFLYCNKIRDSS
jgi:hypothetical protein